MYTFRLYIIFSPQETPHKWHTRNVASAARVTQLGSRRFGASRPNQTTPDKTTSRHRSAAQRERSHRVQNHPQTRRHAQNELVPRAKQAHGEATLRTRQKEEACGAVGWLVGYLRLGMLSRDARGCAGCGKAHLLSLKDKVVVMCGSRTAISRRMKEMLKPRLLVDYDDQLPPERSHQACERAQAAHISRPSANYRRIFACQTRPVFVALRCYCCCILARQLPALAGSRQQRR